jgi:hypothetical protein
MLLAIGWRHHRGVRAHEPGAPLMEPGICMGDGLSTEAAKSAGMSPLRLRVGVSHPPVDRPVLGVGAPRRGFPQRAQ